MLLKIKYIIRKEWITNMADLRKKIVMIVSAVIVGISLIFTFVNYQNYSAKVDENEKQYHDLKSEYEDVMKKQKPVSEDDVKNGLNSAKNQVMMLQTC